MRRILLLIGLLTTLWAEGQYWQQQASYRISVRLNDRRHRLDGALELTYVNASPDTLRFLWIHCWPNAYKDGTTAFARQLAKEPGGRARLRAIRDKGAMDSLHFTVNGVEAATEPHPDWNDVVKLLLPVPLSGGDSVRIQTPFRVQLPTYNSRMGHSGRSYMLCQWYPKVAVYDRKGWHPMPYLDRGEFYNDFGDYDVNITLPGAYVVGATGVLQTTAERERYIALGDANRTRKGAPRSYHNEAAEKTLRFRAHNVTDFALFADRDFLIEHDRMNIGDSSIDLFTYHHAGAVDGWQGSTAFLRDALAQYSGWLGNYPYPVAQAVEGPENDMSGGMEYPMIALISLPAAVDSTLDVTIAHEAGHNWFPMIVSSNERDHAWMDEGLNTWFEQLYSARKYGSFGGANTMGAPSYLRSDPEALRRWGYTQLARGFRSRAAVDQPADSFADDDDYYEASYDKTALWLFGLEKTYGKEALLRALKRYFEDWKFRHPYPEDLRHSLEVSLQADLRSAFEKLRRKGRFAE